MLLFLALIRGAVLAVRERKAHRANGTARYAVCIGRPPRDFSPAAEAAAGPVDSQNSSH
jgi:hypothetical protein